MKKLLVLVLFSVVLTGCVSIQILNEKPAQIVPTRMTRMTVINKSNYDVFIKLEGPKQEGSETTQAFYYLTIPAGSIEEPSIKKFTIKAALHDRTTWMCDGIRSSGKLAVTGNIRLTFASC